MTLNKERIRQRFTRAAQTYDRQAVIQLRVADRLLTLLKHHDALTPQRVLEIGCCTGLLTNRLVQEFSGLHELYVNDLVPDFKPLVANRIAAAVDPVFLEGDVESMELPYNLDLVISSSTFHWLEDLGSLLRRLAEHLTPRGTLAFSMYSSRNLWELREITGIGLDYYGLDELKKLVAENFTVLACDEEMITFTFQDPLTLLHHLRETGVNALEGSLWNRARLQNFIKEYKARFEDQDQVSLTYHPVYFIARKPKL